MSSQPPVLPSTAVTPDSPTVVIKLRPLLKHEQHGGAWSHSHEQIWQQLSSHRHRPALKHMYRFDRVYGEDEGTSVLHEERVSHITRHAMRGFNAAVMAYGQTSSGKTTMIRGSPDVEDEGLISRCVTQLFEEIDADDDPDRWSLQLSYIEIYNEVVGDLLTGATNLTLYDRKGGGLTVEGLEEVEIDSWEAAERFLEKGDRRRHIGATTHNERSSRAHVICRLRVTRSATLDEPSTASAELNIVDLAGSERVSAHGKSLGAGTAREGGHINQSLLVLSTVIQKLVEAADAAANGGVASGSLMPPMLGNTSSRASIGSSSSSINGGGSGGGPTNGGLYGGGNGGGLHVPYRSSKITRLLQGSLGGGAVSLIVCNVTPATHHIEETHNTLRFATRARRSRAAPVSTSKPDKKTRMQKYEAEIEELKRALAEQVAINEEVKRGAFAAPSASNPALNGGAPTTFTPPAGMNGNGAATSFAPSNASAAAPAWSPETAAAVERMMADGETQMNGVSVSDVGVMAVGAEEKTDSTPAKRRVRRRTREDEDDDEEEDHESSPAAANGLGESLFSKYAAPVAFPHASVPSVTINLFDDGLARSPDGGEWKVRATAAEEKIAALETALALEREAKERAENDAGEIVLAGEAYAAEVVTLENELHHVRNLLEDERSISGAASPASARSRGSQEGEMMADVPWWAACLPAANQLNRPGFERRRRIANL